jgi:hypothetical protein
MWVLLMLPRFGGAPTSDDGNPADEAPPEDDVTPPDEDEDITGGASESQGE